MSKEKKVVYNYNTLGFWSILTLIFITLKLTGYINWPWLYVLLPAFVPLIIFVLVFVVVFIVMGSIAILDFFLDR